MPPRSPRWRGDDGGAGSDILGGRPTVLWALALDGLPPPQQQELLTLVNRDSRLPAPDSRLPSSNLQLSRFRALYDQAGVFDKATRLIDKHRERAEKIADEIQPDELRALLYYLIDSVLDHAETTPTPTLTAIQ